MDNKKSNELLAKLNELIQPHTKVMIEGKNINYYIRMGASFEFAKTVFTGSSAYRETYLRGAMETFNLLIEVNKFYDELEVQGNIQTDDSEIIDIEAIKEGVSNE